MNVLIRSPKAAKRRTAAKRRRKVESISPRNAPTNSLSSGGGSLLAGTPASTNQRALFGEITGTGSRLAVATHGSIPCLKMARQIVFGAFEQLAAAEPGRTLALQVIYGDPNVGDDSVRLDFQELKRRAMHEIRLHFDDAFGIMKPMLIEERVTASAFIIGFRALRRSGSHRRRAVPAPSVGSLVDVAMTHDAKGVPSKLRDAVMRMWSWSDLAPVSTAADSHNDLRRQLHCQAARLLTPLDRTMFGKDRGRRLASHLSRLLHFRAELLDVSQTSSLRPEAVHSFLAGLPVNGDGERLKLPVIVLP